MPLSSSTYPQLVARSSMTSRRRPLQRWPTSVNKLPRFNTLEYSRKRNSYVTFLALIIAIPTLTLLHLRHLLNVPPPFSFEPSSDSDVVTHQYPPFDVPVYSRLAPRHSLFALAAQRLPLYDNTGPQPTVHAVLVCDSPCCTSNVQLAISALLSQTLIPTHLTIIHSCSGTDIMDFLRLVRHALTPSAAHATDSVNLRPHTTFHPCLLSQRESCSLSYLSDIANIAWGSRQYNHFTLLLSDRVLLEHAAVEKGWLSLAVRSHVPAVRFQAYNYASLAAAQSAADPLLVHSVLPLLNASSQLPVSPVPVIYNSTFFAALSVNSRDKGPLAPWVPLIHLVSAARILREPLMTFVGQGEQSGSGVLSFSEIGLHNLPPHLFSELAFLKHVSQLEEDEVYSGPNHGDEVNFDTIPHWPLRMSGKKTHAMIIMPWMQMGGSEKCALDIAEAMVSRSWGVSFVLTMPMWEQDQIGEVAIKNEWLHRALHITSDVFELLNLAAHHHSSRLFRYLLETRQPDYVMIMNARWGYTESGVIKKIVPNAVVADYNHMIHMDWLGGGLPRFGANHSANFDVHLTASNDVSDAMRRWIDPSIMEKDLDRVQTCYIGSDPTLIHSGIKRDEVRQSMREKIGVPSNAYVILFAGRFVLDKGIDVVARIIKRVSEDESLRKKLFFVCVGRGDKQEMLRELLKTPEGQKIFSLHPPAKGLEELRDYYAMSDMFFLPSVNEGIALVLYEAMSAGLLAMATDVGGQKELLGDTTGILLPNLKTVTAMANHSLDRIKEVLRSPQEYAERALTGQKLSREKFTTIAFKSCVLTNLEKVAARKTTVEQTKPSSETEEYMTSIATRVAREERVHGMYSRSQAARTVAGLLTIGVKTYICDKQTIQQVENLLRSIRVHYPQVRVLLANDGPEKLQNESFVRNDPFTEEVILPKDSGISFGRNSMVNQTTTRFFLLLDDDHVLDDVTNLKVLVDGIIDYKFDIVGMRVRNLPGIEELERVGILIPRYVALIRAFQNRELTLCVWNENQGPSVVGMRHPIPVDVLHNAFVGRTEALRRSPWRNELKVNEHMTFFLDAKEARLSVGYLPSVFVHHRARQYSGCYYSIRFREDRFRQYLRYQDQFLWDVRCGRKFPEKVREHLMSVEVD